MLKWTYQNKEIESMEDLPNGYGFVYVLTYKSEKYYIGKKAFYDHKTLPVLKSGEERPNAKRIGKNKNGKRVYYDIVSKESNWKKYEGSHKEIDEDDELVSKEILEIAKTKRHLTYLEAWWLFNADVLASEDCYNQNIMGNFFRSNLI